MIISNNQAAFNVWANQTRNASNLRKSFNAMSTGVISVTDDPAGVGVSERMRARTASISAARRNVETGISMTQTSDGWLSQMGSQISRMKSLAVQAGGVMTDADKKNLRSEFKAMQNEVARITSKLTAAGKFNGLYLFRGGDGTPVAEGDQVGSGPMTIQDGPDVDQTQAVELENLEVTNDAVIGTVHTYEYDADHQVVASAHTDVTWSEIIDSGGGVDVDSAEAVGKMDVAVEAIASAKVAAATKQRVLESRRDELLMSEANTRSSESKIRDVDMARQSTFFAKSQILNKAGYAMLAQANQLPASMLQLLG